MKNQFSLGTLFFCLFCCSAQANILTFEQLPHDMELQGVGATIVSNGYSLKFVPGPSEQYPTEFISVAASWRFNQRSTALNASSCSGTTQLAASNNLAFSLHSIDLDELNGDLSGSVTFTGISADSSLSPATLTVELNGTPKWQTFKFPDTFTNLKSVSWQQGDCVSNFPHMFDNITVSQTQSVLSFEELPHDQPMQSAGDKIISNGFELRFSPGPHEPYPSSFATVGPSWPFNEKSSALNANSCSATTKLTAENNKSFSLISIDLDELNGDDSGTVSFVGTTSGRFPKLVKQTVRLNGTAEWQTVTFPATFKNLKSVSWKQANCIKNPPHMFDNIRLMIKK